MNRELRVWPRLGASTAGRLYESLQRSRPEELRDSADSDHPDAAPVATGGRPVSREEIEKVQARIRDLSDELGYPRSLTKARVSDFDRPATAILHESMQIIPADAASEGVWSFLSLVVLPDVAVWRFPDKARDRMTGRPRNVFRRLWWRAECVGSDLIDVENGLGEDELVNIMERPSLAANPVVARAIAASIFSLGRGSPVARSEVMRDVAKRMLRLMGVLSFDILGASEVQDVVASCLQQSLDAMSKDQ